MKFTKLNTMALISIVFSWGAAATGSVPSKIGREVIELATKKSPLAAEKAASKATCEAIEIGLHLHGTEAYRLVDDLGIDFAQKVAGQGDEAVTLVMSVSPQARRALAHHFSELFPLARRVGPEVLELEAKCPGIARKACSCFGDSAAKQLAQTVPAEDLPRLVKYGQAADSPATKKLLLQRYADEGAKLFQRIPPKLVLASGLSASMLYGTHRGTKPMAAVSDQIQKNPSLARHVANLMFFTGAGIVLLFCFLLLWRFRLLPWHQHQRSHAVSQPPEEPPVTDRDIATGQRTHFYATAHHPSSGWIIDSPRTKH